MSTRLTFSKYRQIRWYSTKEKMKVIDSLEHKFSNKELNPKHHPGVVKPKFVEQPPWLLDAIKTHLRDESISFANIVESGKKLGLHLKRRHPPMEKDKFHSIVQEVQNRMQRTHPEQLNDTMTTEDLLKNQKAQRIFKELTYNWAPIYYDRETSFSYLVNRSVPEYSILYKIFSEIKTRDTNFSPKSLFDFGSGIGTVMWAASQLWFKSLKEYLCIDSCGQMNDLSEYFSKKTKPQIVTSQIFYKQFLPVSTTPTYDLVVSAYSLLELPSQTSRLEVIAQLYRKTNNYLVIVEHGTNVGFNLIIEARDYILNYAKGKSGTHVVSPCPHDLECPRYRDDDTPCNFEIVYSTLAISDTSMHLHERYSYIVFKKDERPAEDPQWSRIVRPVLTRSKHCICRVCSASGKLEEHIFTKWKNGRNTYRCARLSDWGDCLPFVPEKTENTEESE